jgi:vacuolar-type H+-ATPase subunit I/STV1
VRAAQESAAAAQGEAAALETALMLAQLNLEREAQSREALETARDEAVAAVAQAARTEAALRAELGAARAELETTRDQLGRAVETTRDELGAARAELETTRDELGRALEMSHAQLAAVQELQHVPHRLGVGRVLEQRAVREGRRDEGLELGRVHGGGEIARVGADTSAPGK